MEDSEIGSRLRIREVFTDATRKILAVESVEFQQSKAGAGFQLHGTVTPVAVVVRDTEGIRAFDMDAGPIQVDELIRDLPQLTACFTTQNNG